MGLLCSRNKHYNEADNEENAQTAEIERRIEQETKAEKHIQKLLLLAMHVFIFLLHTNHLQIKLLFQTGFDEAELKSYISVIHANVYQTIKILYDGSKELAQNNRETYEISSENKEIGEKLSKIGGRLDYPRLTKELAQDIETLWKDAAIQETYARGNELQVPDCANYFMENLQRLADANYIPTKEDVLYARVRTTGVVEIQFSPVGESKKSGEVYRLFDVGGQRNERRKWIHLFEGVTAVIFCAAVSLKTSFMLFLNKFDIFEKKVLNVRAKHDPDRVDRVFKIYRTTALDQKLVKKTFKLVDETLRRRNLFEAGLL
ncbi:hypothetical protein GBA52_028343 [Prunus armeniaca]|nr:hypothetical protein GBA52_028343 [Prunus armeniaca]